MFCPCRFSFKLVLYFFLWRLDFFSMVLFILITTTCDKTPWSGEILCISSLTALLIKCGIFYFIICIKKVSRKYTNFSKYSYVMILYIFFDLCLKGGEYGPFLSSYFYLWVTELIYVITLKPSPYFYGVSFTVRSYSSLLCHWSLVFMISDKYRGSIA